MIDAIFVYGTLKRGQIREQLWPATPRSVHSAWVRGALYGRDDYPAMRPGDHRVAGELWRFDSQDIDRVLNALDRIEGTNQPGHPDLYRREISQVFDLNGEPLARAYLYFYATDPVLDGFELLAESEQDGLSRWP